MADPLILPLERCTDPALVGGKAAGLGRLMTQGFRVPPGLCLTTAAYRNTLQTAGLDLSAQWTRLQRAPDLARSPLLEECRRAVASVSLPQALLTLLESELNKLERLARAESEAMTGVRWAVRSSAFDEDTAKATFGGLYRTALGVSRDSLAAAILDCWTSLWAPAVLAYRSRMVKTRRAPAMAVIIQPLLFPRAAGVAYSRHPVTGQANQVAINAVLGLAEPLMAGQVTPDHYVVEVGSPPSPPRLLQRQMAAKTDAMVATGTGLVVQPLSEADQNKPVLEDREALALAGLVKDVERAFGKPVDVEWAIDGSGIWLLQARPIPTRGESAGSFFCETIVWSRANFRETLPDLPSPLTLSFVQEFMENNILRHYREAGCLIPPGLSSIRVIRGRPYINVTLFQSLMAQLGGDPQLVTEQMGGEVLPAPPVSRRLPWWRLIRAGLRLQWKISRAPRQAPARFAELKQQGTSLVEGRLDDLTERELLDRRRDLIHRLRERDLTFATVAGVSQALSVLGMLLGRRTKDWRSLLNDATQGFGSIVSANQIFRLMDLAEAASGEPSSRTFLLAEPWAPETFRTTLAGTKFLRAFDEFLAEYGHRAVGESDGMSPRFAETPEYVLGIVRSHLQTPARSSDTLRREQEATRQAALAGIRRAFSWRWHEWIRFRRWHRSLGRYLELREANRHHLMYVTAGFRRLALFLGSKLAARGVVEHSDDLFFLMPDEIEAIVAEATGGEKKDWKRLVAERRAERKRNAGEAPPDTVIWRMGAVPSTREEVGEPGLLRGMPISAGYVEGPVRLVLSPEDMKKVQRGDILVAPVIDPGMAPLFGLAAGLVVEMGGTLSHGAIIAREYGLPAVANVRGATRLFKDGERVAVDASGGEIRRLELG